MKITVTYPDTRQLSPDEWKVYTKVLHFEEGETLREVFNKIVADWGIKKKADVEIHFLEEK